MTPRGFKEAEMLETGELIAHAALDFEARKEESSTHVFVLCEHFPLYKLK